MNKSRELTISSYQEQVSRILGRNENPEKSMIRQQKPTERLSLNQIQNITRSMFREKKAYTNNMGIITNIKGKMYCLKLGEVSKPKKFTDFFYSTQYRRKFRSECKPSKIL